MDQSELLGLLGSSHNYVQNLYMEPVKEVPTNWYLFTNGNSTLQSINLPQATKIGYNAFNKVHRPDKHQPATVHQIG